MAMNLLDRLVAKHLPEKGKVSDIKFRSSAISRPRLMAKAAALEKEGYAAEIIGEEGSERIFRISWLPEPEPKPKPRRRRTAVPTLEFAMT